MEENSEKPDRNVLDANKFTLGAFIGCLEEGRPLTKLEGFFRDMWLSKKLKVQFTLLLPKQDNVAR
jgi:hypothetical protein